MNETYAISFLACRKQGGLGVGETIQSYNHQTQASKHHIGSKVDRTHGKLEQHTIKTCPDDEPIDVVNDETKTGN